MRKVLILSLLAAGIAAAVPSAAGSGEEGSGAFGTHRFDDYERPQTCRQCHVDIYHQWEQAMMSQSFVHHWDEIEYFDLAKPHAAQDPALEPVVSGCNGCHAPVAWVAGEGDPPPPEAGSRANEGVSCDFCHTITGRTGDPSVNFNYTVEPGRTKNGNREGGASPHHETRYVDFVRTAEYCGICHNEKDPYGVWVKSTQLEWKEGPYAEQGVPCHVCHMPRAPGRSANTTPREFPDIAQHLFHGAHDPGKVKGAIEVRMNPDNREVEPGDIVVISVQLFNGKCGHKVPSGSAEERQLWLHVEAHCPDGRIIHLPVDRKGFEGEEQTITSNELAYQDMGMMLGDPSFAGLPRDAVEYEGDRIFCLPYFDPQGRRTIAQWNTASLGTDYRIGPRETKIETYTWTVPDDLPEGTVVVRARLSYRRLVKSVAEFLKVPEDETEIIPVNEAETRFEVYEY
jgi:nitrate/TMAO reductase-like tetraheme cytochrome c subunit